jgi:hypothetical protein
MMNRNPESFDTSPMLDLDASPQTLRLPVGAAIFAVRGTVWITQERLRDDIILAAGQRFDVTSKALILASAVKGDAAIHVVQPAEAVAHRHRDIHDFARARASQLRREEIANSFAALAATAASWVTRVRAALAPTSRAASH